MHYRVAVYGSAAKYFQHFEQKQQDAEQLATGQVPFYTYRQ
jgi:hypothetical protein